MEPMEVVTSNTEIRRQADRDGLHKRRGIWHYKLKIGGKWKENSTHTKNYQQARKIRQQALQDQEQGRLPTDMAKWPFEQAAQAWLAGREKMVSRNTRRIDRERLKPLIMKFGGKRLCEITGEDVNGYRVLRGAQVGNRTINLETKVLRMILKQAKLWSRIGDDCRPLPENKQGPGKALLPEEEQQLFDTAKKSPDWFVAYHVALLAANTTARGCELKGLRLADVNLISRSITVRRLTTKTDAGTRVIPLNETAAFALVRLLERAQFIGASDPEHYLLPAIKSRREKVWVFTKPMGSWRKAWGKLTKAAGLSGLRFHDLRHHCITRLAEAGVPEQTLMAIAGHISRHMLEHYSHIRMQAKREAVSALDRSRPIPPPSVQQVEPRAN